MIRTWAPGAGGTAAAAVRRAFVFVLPGLWVLGVVAWELCCPTGGRLLQLLAAAPAIACAGTGRRQCVLLGGVCALLALVPFGAVEPAAGAGTRVMTCGAILAVIGAGYLTAGRRLRLVRELERTREVAVAAQRVVLRPLPRRVDGVLLAADHLSASEGAMVGGDLYEVVGTRHGVRAVIGDVRGHGLEAIGTVAAMLGSFREVAHDEPELGGVLRRLERTHQRHLRERALVERPAAGDGGPVSAFAEEFVTLLLLEVARDGSVTALNCGHPWPYRVACRAVAPVAPAEPMPPLGLFPLPEELSAVRCGQLRPGEGLFLHTDGAAEARDATGEFFPLAQELRSSVEAAAAPCGPSPSGVVGEVREALLRHADGRLTDDVALVMLSNDRVRVPAQQARGTPPGARLPR
ncbi:Stage II sporulation protein E (SpoIIE) [Streptomyces sp. 2224.1]|uniref:PP2C family protein-serine/threonine phosphatase n=1 Tax=unclassified Streptomyces TaxID=2593676 RepID=UPI00088040AB|nr:MULTISPECIES: PP2C family protein-serine/threonine phosphatase [unclassified Streptomyces]PBC81418.1 stage II sporulation protein E [Streptomyces sp. 2321.6]SDR55114.1 Stage II sporulation protein E (SpoIIE) [Streptomyces sp. KS_16]SEC14421.1 Stage II sporulation protein E (SpoIIE) [Streptomyces sp. 2133.1]SED16629.1 Stage II sporulation protein E (SpoIIE) [Streptomyces sp. 2224.1]SEF08040.1 Stage II sporulation protein E (SpoIIE) [Streptomyces sp. 2112.3]